MDRREKVIRNRCKVQSSVQMLQSGFELALSIGAPKPNVTTKPCVWIIFFVSSSQNISILIEHVFIQNFK